LGAQEQQESSMNLGELINTFRSDIRDTEVPYLWPDADVIEYANDAVNEACRRAKLITDSETAACCTLTITPPAVSCLFHSSVIYVKDIIDVNGVPLVKVPRQALDYSTPGWRAHTATKPEFWVPDLTSRTFRPYPAPSQAATFTATVIRTPLTGMSNPATDSPEIPARYHRPLVHWMRFRAYNRRDSETYDADAAKKAYEDFAAEFGAPVPAIEEQWAWERYGYANEGGLP
jgi:hypothetical protein